MRAPTTGGAAGSASASGGPAGPEVAPAAAPEELSGSAVRPAAGPAPGSSRRWVPRAGDRPLVEVGRCGAFLGVDKVSFPKGPTNVELANLVRDACEARLERQLILSSDVARRTMLSRYGGKGYPTVMRDFVPMLKERGIPDATIETILSDNPRRMLTLSASC